MNSGIFELSGLLMNTSDISEAANFVSDQLRDSKSISAKAGKAIATYPVYFSNTFGDYDTMVKVTKFLEIQFAIFTLIDMGLDPVLREDEDVGSRLTLLGTEELAKKIEDGVDFDVDFNLNKNTSLSITNNPRIGTEKLIESMNFPNTKDNIDNMFSKYFSLENDDIKIDTNNRKTMDNLEKKMAKGHPTIITFTYKQGPDVGKSLTFSMVIKANAHIISSDDMRSIFTSFVENDFKFFNFIRMSSGEISFFKDYIFHLKSINKDTEIYKRLGKYPFYRQLMERKQLKGLKLLINSITVILNLKRRNPAGIILPKFTFITNEDEIEFGFKKRLKLLKKTKNIIHFINKMMLLCIGTYDNTIEKYSFFFNGLRESFNISENELDSIGNNNNSTKDMQQALLNLTSKM